MNKTQHTTQIPDKALKLLPWYATGWLTSQERTYVQKTLSQYPEFQEMLNSEHKMINAIKEDKTLLDHSCLETTEIRLGKVLQQLPETNKKSNKATNRPKQKTKEYISLLFSGFSPKKQYATFAVITTMTIALLFTVVAPLVDEGNTYYHPATSTITQSSSNTTTLLVGLNAEPSDPRLLRLLNENNAKIGEIPGKSGMHHLSLSVKLSTLQTKNLLNKLTENNELFWFAGEKF